MRPTSTHTVSSAARTAHSSHPASSACMTLPRAKCSVTLRTVIAIVANKEETLSSITAYIDETLNMSGPGKGDPNDEFNTHMREIARVHAMQSVDAIRRLLK